VRVYGSQSRGAITGITLFAGFASTLGWPLSAWLEAEVGWRNACLVWAGLHLVLGAPLNASLPKAVAMVPRANVPNDKATTAVPANRTAALLALVFAITWFVSTAMAAHLPWLLQAAGAGLAAAVFAAALVGPAQVVARLLELGLLRRFHPLRSAQLAVLAHPLGAAVLMVVGGPAVMAFTLLHGAGNGIMTIANGTLPLVLFGPHGYGLRQSMLMVPARIAQASAPFVFGVLIDRFGAGALWVSSGLGLVSFAALYWLAADSQKERRTV
jgi:predicted MFS family arabinose efflux permease